MQIIWIKIWKLQSPYWKDTLKVIWPKTRPNRLCFGVHACLPLLCVLTPSFLCAGRGWNTQDAEGIGGQALTHTAIEQAKQIWGRSIVWLWVCSCRNPAPNICSSWLPTRIISLVRVQFCSCSAWQNRPPPPAKFNRAVHGQQHGCAGAQMITLSEAGRRPKQSNF